MAPSFWPWVANPAASIIAALFGLTMLLWFKSHLGPDGRTLPQAIVAVVLQSLTLYTVTVIVIGHFFLHIPASLSVGQYFGDDRLAWLFLGLSADFFARLYKLFKG